MAKKTHKPNVPRQTLERARRELYGTQVVKEGESVELKSDNPAVTYVTREDRKTKTKFVREVNLAEEYAYVVQDLRNMGVLAVVIFAVLIAASLFV